MRFGLNILSTILHSFGSRKVTSSIRNTHLPNIFARRDPHTAARSANLRAARSAGRIRNGRTASTTWRTADPVRGTKNHRRAPRPLRRCNNVIIPPPPTQPRPQFPGAYTPEPSFVMPIFPGVDEHLLEPLVYQKLFLDALYAGRKTLLRASEERREAAKARKRAEDEEYVRLLEQDSKKAREAQRRAEEEECARLLEEDLRKAREAQRRAEEAEFARLLEEDRRRAQEAHRRAEAEEAARRERKRLEEERRRERERLEEERRRRAQHEAFMERERRERERQARDQQYRKAKAESGQHHLVERLRVYEETWAALRSNVGGTKPLRFRDIPWPVFGNVWSGDDVNKERVREFMCHPLHEYMRTSGGGLAKATRLELLRWHPDKFNGKVLNRVVEADRKAVQDAAEHIVHVLNELSAEKR